MLAPLKLTRSLQRYVHIYTWGMTLARQDEIHPASYTGLCAGRKWFDLFMTAFDPQVA